MSMESPRENTRRRILEVTGSVTFTRHIEGHDYETAEQAFLETIMDDHGSQIARMIDPHSIEVNG